VGSRGTTDENSELLNEPISPSNPNKRQALMHFLAKPFAAVGRASSRGWIAIAMARQFHASIRGGAIPWRGRGSN
jgi:hypothetical protein